MKKYISVIIIATVLALSFSGCNKKNSEPDINAGKACEVALITDEGTVEDGGLNESAYNGMMKYCNEKGIAANCYIPADANKDSYLTEIGYAVKAGAKTIICPGNLLEEAVFDAQKKYSNVNFVLVDGEPHNSDYSDTSIAENTLPIRFGEEESGFLAGYAAVREGYRFLGFMGGIPEDSVIRYGYGFVQGADYAAIELGVKVYIAYVYADTFTADINIKNMAGNWYENGIGLIFTCGGSMNSSVISAAEEHGQNVIVADKNTRVNSNAVLFTVYNNVEDSVYDAIDSSFNDSFKGGEVKRLSLKDDDIGIDLEHATFKNFSEVEYEAICNAIKNGDIVPYDNTEIATTKELNLVNTQIVYAEY